MKLLKNVAFVLLFCSTFVACKKDNDSPFVIEGSWTGKLGTGSATPTGSLGLNIKPGGVLERISSGSISATGTWQLSGNTFTGQYTFISNGTIVNITGTIDKGQNKISGTWMNDGNEQGTWYVTK